MIITDNDLIEYLIKNEEEEYSTPKGTLYSFVLSDASNPTYRLQNDIIFYSDSWEDSLTCPPNTAMRFFDEYNSGKKNRTDLRRLTGERTPSRRGG